MNQETYNQMLKKYLDKEYSWLTFGAILKEAIKSKLILGMDPRKVSEIIRGYNFVEKEGLLENKKVEATSIYAVIRMPFVRTIISPEKFLVALELLKNGQLTEKYVKNLSAEAHGVDIQKQSKYNNLARRIRDLTKYLDEHQDEIKDMRKFISIDCDELSQRLQCISDETYHDLWKERKEFRL
jgi:hypothetical protein